MPKLTKINKMKTYLESIAKNTLSNFDLISFESEYRNSLLFVVANSKCDSNNRKRYHLLVISSGVNTIVFNSSNIVDYTYNHSIEDVKKLFINYVNNLNKNIIDLL